MLSLLRSVAGLGCMQRLGLSMADTQVAPAPAPQRKMPGTEELEMEFSRFVQELDLPDPKRDELMQMSVEKKWSILCAEDMKRKVLLL